MAYRELSLIDVKELLRRWQAGRGLRETARETGLDRKTVRRYVAAAEALGVGATEDLTDDVVHSVADMVQAREAVPMSSRREALYKHEAAIRQWLLEDGLRLTKVHRRLRARSVEVSYATLRRFAVDVLDWGKRPGTVRLPDPPPGEEAQIDFGEMGVVDDPDSGRRRRLHVLIVTLSMSRHQFVWPTFRQTTEAVIEGLEAAWQFFGGVVQRIVPDNTKAIVVKADPCRPRLQRVFSEYAQARGFFVDAARVRKPKDKARVERQVPYVRQDWFAGETFLGMAAARVDAARWCREVAGTRIHGTTRRVPIEVFEAEERPALQPPPDQPWDIPKWTEAKVHTDYHVQAGKALYSVPWPHRGRRVEVRLDSHTARIYLGTELLKVHGRVDAGRRSTDPNDYPPGKQVDAQRSIDGLIKRGLAYGPSVGDYVRQLLSGPLPWTWFRQVYRLLRLCERYGAARVDAVCERSLSFDVVDVTRVERMVKSAYQVEAEAAQQGRLRPLPRARFARDASAFAVRGKPPRDGGDT